MVILAVVLNMKTNLGRSDIAATDDRHVLRNKHDSLIEL